MQLKQYLGEWEAHLQRMLESGLRRAAAFTPDKFPQTKAQTQAIEAWRRNMSEEWEALAQGHTLTARVSQQDVTKMQAKLAAARQELRSLTPDGASAGGAAARRRRALEAETTELNGLRVLELGDIDDSDEVIPPISSPTRPRPLFPCSSGISLNGMGFGTCTK